MSRTLGVALAGFALVFACQGIGTVIHNRQDRLAVPETASRCSVSDVAHALNDPRFLAVPSGSAPIFANDFAQTPGLLFLTPVRTIAGLYHRDVPGITDLLTLFRDTGVGFPLAHGLLTDHSASFVMVCPGHANELFGAASLALFHRQGASSTAPTLYTALSQGDAPPWLRPRPWPVGITSDLRLYQLGD